MSEYQLKKNLIDEIYNLLDKPNESLASILRRAIRLAVLCDKEEYKILFDIHLDGVKLGEKGRIEKWKDENKTPVWHPIDAFLEDRKVSDGKALTAPIEEVENSLKNTTEIKNKLTTANKYKEAKSVVQQEIDLRLILSRVCNRVSLFLREVESMEEKPTTENNISDNNNISEISPIYNWLRNNASILVLVISFVAFVISAMWLARDRDYEPALAVLGSFVTFVTIIFNKGIKGLFFIIGFLFGIILAAFLFYFLPASNKINITSATEKSEQKNSNQEKVNQPIQQSNEITDFKVVRDADRTLSMEAWYFYTGDLGLENVLLHPFIYDSSGEMMPMRSVSGEIIVINRKAIATMELTYEPLKEGDIKKSTEIRLCIMTSEKGWLHCQNFPYEKEWK